MGKNVNIVGAGMRTYVHIDSNNKDIWTPGEGPRQRLDYTTLTVKAKYPINLHIQKKDLFQVYTILEATVFYLLVLQKYISSKQQSLK